MALNLSAARALDSPTKVAVESFLASCHACGASTDLLIGGYRGSRLVGAAVVAGAIKSHAGVTFLSATHDPVSCEHGTHIMQAVVLHAERFGFRLLQHLCAPEDDDRACVLSESGYRYLTRLIYLRRDCGGDVYPASMLNDVDWVTYSAKTDALFRAALEATYVDSLDCPELTGLRDTEEVMASHRSTGRFDASLWWLALRGDVPVGVLLLSRIESTQALEVVYVGVAHDARGSGGLGRAHGEGANLRATARRGLSYPGGRSSKRACATDVRALGVAGETRKRRLDHHIPRHTRLVTDQLSRSCFPQGCGKSVEDSVSKKKNIARNSLWCGKHRVDAWFARR